MYKSTQILGYADDLNILGRTINSVTELYKELDRAASAVGLKINTDKTKTMVQTRQGNKYGSHKLKENLEIENYKLENVEEFTYLGTLITDTNDESKEIQRRINQTNKAYYSLLPVMKNKDVHRNTKIKLYQSMIKPVLMYGCEVWSISQEDEERLKTFERKILRKIYGPVMDNGQWRIRHNAELYNLYQNPNVITDIKLRRLQWAGHVIRMSEERIPKKLLTGRLYKDRPKGRPKKRWEDGVKEDSVNMIGVRNWKEGAKNRENWRHLLGKAKARFGL